MKDKVTVRTLRPYEKIKLRRLKNQRRNAVNSQDGQSPYRNPGRLLGAVGAPGMHLIRLLLSGISTMRDGFVPVKLEEHREKLLAIRRGEMPWEEVEDWRKRLHQEFNAASETTTLPERPDYERANAFLIEARRFAKDEG